MTARPDGQMNTAAAFAVKTPRENKRTRSEPEHVQDLVTPKPPPSNKKKAASNKEDALNKNDAKGKRKSELQRQRRAARSKDEKDEKFAREV